MSPITLTSTLSHQGRGDFAAAWPSPIESEGRDSSLCCSGHTPLWCRSFGLRLLAPLSCNQRGGGLAGGFDVGFAVGGDGDFGYCGVFGDAVCADYGSGFFD